MDRRKPPFRTPLIRRSVAVLVTAGALLALVGCNTELTTVKLWSDRSDIAPIVELFNASQQRYRVVLNYTKTPADDLLTHQEQPDVVFGDYLANSTILPRLRSMERTLKQGDIDGSQFYASLLELGEWNGGVRALPVSFDLPAVMFKDSPENRALPAFALELETLRTEGSSFNVTEDGRALRIGFSPRWKNEFLYAVARLLNTRFRESGDGSPVWNDAAFREAIETLVAWTGETNGGVERENAFEEQYLYDPALQLLRRDRIRFWYTSSSAYYRYTEGERNELGYRWLRGERGIPVLEDVRFMGVPKGGENQAGAAAFMKWFFSPDNQRRIMEQLTDTRVRGFGLLGGFSAVRSINRNVLAEMYPSLLGNIPLPSDLSFPERLPKNWDSLKSEVIEPWLYREVSDMGHDASLSEQIHSWVLQQGE
jgi:ABC-type glycerol-3-phosphate transport system substrate-binding protein